MNDKRRTGHPDPGGIDVDESALERWSRRKEMARQGTPLPDPDEAAGDLEAGVEKRDPVAVSEPGDRADAEDVMAGPPALPPLESLGEDSDYSAFMASEVSPDLRRQALRKLFHSAKFNVRDGLDDYDLDYTNPEPLGNIVTAEMRRRILREIERLAETEDEAAEETVAIAAGAAEAEAPDGGEPAGEPAEANEDAEDDRPRAS